MTGPVLVELVIGVTPVESKQDVYKNKIPIWDPSQRYQKSIFGGHLLGQSVLTAKHTVPAAFDVHSLQSTFLRPGDAAFDVHYHVERILDGRTLASRLVRAMQGDTIIYIATIGFQRHAAQTVPDPGALTYHEPVPKWARTIKPGSEGLRSTRNMLEDTGFPEQLIKIFKSPLESWHLPVEMRQNPTDFRERSIFRSFKLTTGDRAIHLAAFAWTTDVFLLYTANLAYPSRFPMGMGSATIATSINHSVWFHDPDAKIDEWMVNERRTSWGADGRVLIHQTVWNQETGRLVLTCIQEGFIRMKNGNL